MITATTVHFYKEALLRLIYPANCGVCQNLLKLEEAGICASCDKNLQSLKFDYEQTSLDHVFTHISQAWALYPYESPFKEILAGIKFYGKRWLLSVFSKELKQLAELISSENDYDWIVPIPLENSRLLQRQFNQAGIIASTLSREIHKPVINAIKKCHPTRSQIGLSREERLRNLQFAFQAKVSAAGKKILLVDDVLTTGATAEEAARTLKESGAVHVDLVTLACNSREVSTVKSFSSLYIPSSFVGY